MDYRMNIIVEAPNTGKTAEMKLNASFHKRDGDYGNGYWLSIWNESGSIDKYYDLRYESGFQIVGAKKYLEEWANRYWSGDNGSWKATAITITES